MALFAKTSLHCAHIPCSSSSQEGHFWPKSSFNRPGIGDATLHNPVSAYLAAQHKAVQILQEATYYSVLRLCPSFTFGSLFSILCTAATMI